MIIYAQKSFFFLTLIFISSLTYADDLSNALEENSDSIDQMVLNRAKEEAPGESLHHVNRVAVFLREDLAKTIQKYTLKLLSTNSSEEVDKYLEFIARLEREGSVKIAIERIAPLILKLSTYNQIAGDKDITHLAQRATWILPALISEVIRVGGCSDPDDVNIIFDLLLHLIKDRKIDVVLKLRAAVGLAELAVVAEQKLDSSRLSSLEGIILDIMTEIDYVIVGLANTNTEEYLQQNLTLKKWAHLALFLFKNDGPREGDQVSLRDVNELSRDFALAIDFVSSIALSNKLKMKNLNHLYIMESEIVRSAVEKNISQTSSPYSRLRLANIISAPGILDIENSRRVSGGNFSQSLFNPGHNVYQEGIPMIIEPVVNGKFKFLGIYSNAFDLKFKAP